LKEAEQNTVGKPSFQNLNTPDNAAMIGIVGYQKFLSHKFETSTVVSKARIQF
jgi:N6-L-threonylcarbamoyladenine synthase